MPIRGNVDTRIRKAADGEVDAVVLARAGLARLDRLVEITEVLDPLQMLPAPGQGALAVECRDSRRRAAPRDPSGAGRSAEPDGRRRRARAARRARRPAAPPRSARSPIPSSLIPTTQSGAAVDGVGEIYLRGVAAAVDGSSILRLSATGSPRDPEALGRRLAADLLDAGAADLVRTYA